jgi:hypothetical protein
MTFDELFNDKPKIEKYIGMDLLRGVDTCENPFVVDGVEIGLPFNLSQYVNKYGKNSIPDRLGIYHLFFHDQLVYIGMSKSIKGRLIQHLRDKDMPFHNVLWFCASRIGKNATIEDVLTVEYNLIKKFKPVLNSRGANCR